MKNTNETNEIETLARAIAADLGLNVTVRASESFASEKLGRQVRVRVHCSDKRKTWGALKKIGRALNEQISGKLYTDRRSHFETREGTHGACRGWVTGSAADLRVYPEAAV